MEQLPEPSAGLLTDRGEQGHRREQGQLRRWCSDAQGQRHQLGRGSAAHGAATARGDHGQPVLGRAGGGGQPDHRH